MTNKWIRAIDCMIQNPTWNDKQVAEYVGMTPPSLCNAKKKAEFQEFLTKRLKENWKDSIKIAQKTMIDLAESGDRQAAEYILNSAGYKAPEEINVTTKVITITIDDEED